MTIQYLQDLIEPDPDPSIWNFDKDSDPNANKPSGIRLRDAVDIMRKKYAEDYSDAQETRIRMQDCALHIEQHKERSALVLRTPEGSFPFRASGLRSLIATVSAPLDFLHRIPVENAIADLNFCMKRKRQKFKLRTAVGGSVIEAASPRKIRAVVGNYYSAHDLPEMLDNLRLAFARAGIEANVGCVAARIGVANEIWLTLSPQLCGPLGSAITPCVKVRNGELGNAAYSIDSAVYRTRSAKGFLHKDKRSNFRVRHSGYGTRIREEVAYSLPALFQNAYDMTQEFIHKGTEQITVKEARARLRSTYLNNKSREEAIAIAIAEKLDRQSNADRGLNWDCAELLYREKPLVLEGPSEDSETIAVAELIYAVSQVAQKLDHIKRHRVEREAHGLLSSSAIQIKEQQSLRLTDKHKRRRVTPYHKHALDNASNLRSAQI